MVRKAKKIMQKEKSQDGDVFPIFPFPTPPINSQSSDRESKSSKSTRIMHFLTVNKNKVSSSRSLSRSYAHSKGAEPSRSKGAGNAKRQDSQIEVGRNQCASTKIYSAYNLIKQIEGGYKARIVEEIQRNSGTEKRVTPPKLLRSSKSTEKSKRVATEMGIGKCYWIAFGIPRQQERPGSCRD